MSFEAHFRFECFGGRTAVHVVGASAAEGRLAADRARARLLDAHRRLSRFDPDSELSRLNADPRTTVAASPLLRGLASAVVLGGRQSGGLVDATLLTEIERAGYRESLGPQSRDLAASTSDRADVLSTIGRGPARPAPVARWLQIEVDDEAGTISRPAGVKIDSGGLAKGLLADLVAADLGDAPSFAVDCCGDIRLGGSHERRVLVEDPFGGEPLHQLAVRGGGVATSGIGRRAWTGPEGPAHHILDPATGRPAFTGIVQATAVAPTALLAEIHAKAALLAGPEDAAEWLPHGGVLVGADGDVRVVDAARPLPLETAR